MQKTVLNNPIVAHRGAWLEFNLPENSIASLMKAIEIGVGATEFDVHMTADNVLVVYHDYDYNGLKIEQTTYKELQNFTLENGEKLPRVIDFLEIGLKQKNTKLIFEIKSSETSLQRTQQIVDEVEKLFNHTDYSDRLEFILFSWEACQYLKSKLPNYNVSFLNGDKTPNQVKMANLNGIDYNIKTYKKLENYISESKSLGLSLNTWTVNTIEDLEFFLYYNFDMITTNKPQLFLEEYKNRKSNS
jgi:glycerophosphoryl diester phosphodiesterase